MTNSKRTLLGLGLAVTGLAVVALSFGSKASKAPTIIRESVATNVTDTVVTTSTGEVKASAPKQITTVTANPGSTLLLFGEVDFGNSEALATSITELNQESSDSPIILAIDSPGGSVFGGAKVTAAIQGSRRPVYTVCVGLCASMGAMIHSYGHKRLVVRNSTLMFHNAAGGLQGEVPQMESRLNYIKGFVNKMALNAAKRAGITLAQYDLLIAHELWIEGEDAVARKFADEIINLDLSKIPDAQATGISLKAKTAEVKDNTGIADFIKAIGM